MPAYWRIQGHFSLPPCRTEHFLEAEHHHLVKWQPISGLPHRCSHWPSQPTTRTSSKHGNIRWSTSFNVVILTRWLARMTLAPFPIKNLMVGTDARMRVSSVIFWLSSSGTFRSARRNTFFPFRSDSVRVPTLL
ncbi:Os06g0668250, partial [Oryza sativa Japonica Group]